MILATLLTAFFVIGFLSGIFTLIILLKIFVPESIPKIQKKSESPNRVIHLTEQREQKYNDSLSLEE